MPAVPAALSLLALLLADPAHAAEDDDGSADAVAESETVRTVPRSERSPLALGDAVRFEARVQLDWHPPVDGSEFSTDSFELRRARVAMKTKLADGHIKTKIDLDLGKLRFADVFVDGVISDRLAFRVGRQKTPMLLEFLVSSRFITFAERPMLQSAMAIDRAWGAMAFGTAGAIDYELALMTAGPWANLADAEGVARVRVRPFAPSGTSVLEDLQLGASGSWGVRGDLPAELETSSGFAFLDLAGESERGPMARAGFEAVLSSGPVRLQGEAMGMRRERTAIGGETGRLDIFGGYVDALYMLTGENQPVGKRVEPERPFDPSQGAWGAWQVGARYDHIEVLGAPGPLAVGATTADALKVGVNWYLTSHVRMPIELQRTWFRNEVGGGPGASQEDLATIRIAADI